MVQCVPELVVSAPVASETKSNHSKQRPRMKNTPKRRSPEKTPRLNKPTKKFMSVAPQRADVESDYVSNRLANDKGVSATEKRRRGKTLLAFKGSKIVQSDQVESNLQISRTCFIIYTGRLRISKGKERGIMGSMLEKQLLKMEKTA